MGKFRRLIAPPPSSFPGKTRTDRERLEHFPALASEADHPTRWHMPDVLNDSVPWVRSLKTLYETPISFPASLSPDAGMLVHALVRNHTPKVAVEVGTFCSVSTHWIASALIEGACLHCFDDFGPVNSGPWREQAIPDSRLGFVKDRLSEAGLLDRCTLHPGDSAPTIKSQIDALRSAGGVDLAFIDGDHSDSGATKDFLAIEPVLNTGALVILHDTFPERCGGWTGPRSVMEQVRVVVGGIKKRLGVRQSAWYIAEHANSIGEGLYERADLYLAPMNYGLALLRRIG